MTTRNNGLKKYLSREDAFQEACVRWLALQHPGWLWVHPANEGKRTAFEQVKFKSLGGYAGVSDLIIMEEFGANRGLVVELKCGANACSQEQVDFLVKALAKGYSAAVVYDHVDNFIKVFECHAYRTFPRAIGLFRDSEYKMVAVEDADRVLTKKKKPDKSYRPNKGKLFQPINNSGNENSRKITRTNDDRVDDSVAVSGASGNRLVQP